jgi:hypothetical protein
LPADLPSEPPAPLSAASQALLARFVDYLATERRLAVTSVEAYEYDVLRLLRLAGDAPLAGLTAQEIRRFAGRLHGQGLDGRSIARLLSAWRSFYRWLVRERLSAANPALGVKPPRSGKRLPKVLSPDEASHLLDAIPESPAEVRDLAMLELLYSSGLRRAELVGLDLGDVRSADALVRPQTTEALATLLRRCARNGVRVRVLGSGANLLVGDDGVEGVVILLDAPCFKELQLNAEGPVTAARIGGGRDLGKTIRETVAAGLEGLEPLIGIPASIGGAIRMNAGGKYGAIGDVVRSVTVIGLDG